MATEYQIVSATSPEELAQIVTDALSDGWQCQGGVFCITAEWALSPYLQALVRDPENKPCL